MIIEHVFAKATLVTSVLGYPVTVQGGSHWPADDPLVAALPDMFSADCRYGLNYSGDPPDYMSVPPDDAPSLANDESSAAMTSRVRSRAPSARAQASA